MNRPRFYPERTKLQFTTKLQFIANLSALHLCVIYALSVLSVNTYSTFNRQALCVELAQWTDSHKPFCQGALSFQGEQVIKKFPRLIPESASSWPSVELLGNPNAFDMQNCQGRRWRLRVPLCIKGGIKKPQRTFVFFSELHCSLQINLLLFIQKVLKVTEQKSWSSMAIKTVRKLVRVLNQALQIFLLFCCK